MKNDEFFISKVTEILPEIIKYKKFENLDGPDYTVNKSDVKKIVYQNGTIDEFTDSDIPKIKLKKEEKELKRKVNHLLSIPVHSVVVFVLVCIRPPLKSRTQRCVK